MSRMLSIFGNLRSSRWLSREWIEVFGRVRWARRGGCLHGWILNMEIIITTPLLKSPAVVVNLSKTKMIQKNLRQKGRRTGFD